MHKSRKMRCVSQLVLRYSFSGGSTVEPVYYGYIETILAAQMPVISIAVYLTKYHLESLTVYYAVALF